MITKQKRMERKWSTDLDINQIKLALMSSKFILKNIIQKET